MSSERIRRAELEGFHDGELSSAERERVGAALRSDPAARERLSRVRALDVLARGALLGEPDARRAAGAAGACAVIVPGARGRGGWLSVAAGLVVVAGAGWSVRSVFAPGAGVDSRSDVMAVQDTARETVRTEGVLVYRVPMDAEPVRVTKADLEVEPDAANVLVSMVGEGSLAEAFEAARRHPDALSDEVMAALGERVRSGELAREFLESLPAERRADAVRVWAGNPRLRPAAFDQLRDLLRSSDETARVAGERARADLATRPELATWMASYARGGR